MMMMIAKRGRRAPGKGKGWAGSGGVGGKAGGGFGTTKRNV